MSTKKLQIIDSLVLQAENANTLDGKAASEFASSSEVSQLQNLVGDTSVAEQIETAVSDMYTKTEVDSKLDDKFDKITLTTIFDEDFNILKTTDTNKLGTDFATDCVETARYAFVASNVTEINATFGNCTNLTDIFIDNTEGEVLCCTAANIFNNIETPPFPNNANVVYAKGCNTLQGLLLQINKNTVLLNQKEDIANKIASFDETIKDTTKYPTATAVVNYLKDYYYDYNDIDEKLAGFSSGEDGYSPSAIVEQTDTGATITITDKNGTTSAVITDGTDGISCTHFWSGTALTVTSASGTSSEDLKGETGNSGVYIGTEEPTDSEQVVWLNPNGVPNYGLTNDDKNEIATIVKADLSQIEPNFANSIEECTDASKVYVLPDGYIYACIKKTVEESVTPNFTNQIPISTDTDGTIYNGMGYKTDTYLSSGNVGTRSGIETTGFIPFDNTDNFVIYLSGITANNTDGNFRIALYRDKEHCINQLGSTQLDSNNYAPVDYTIGEDGNINKLDFNAIVDAFVQEGWAKPSFFRLCSPNIDSNSIITVNEEITYTTTESITPNFTNQIPISTDTDGSVYDNDGFAENMYLSSGVPASRSNIDCSGFIPIGCGSTNTSSSEQVIRMSEITAKTDTNFRIAFYDSNKTYLGMMMYGNQFDNNSYNIPIPYETDSEGNYIVIDLSALTAEFRDKSALETAFVRISCPNIDNNSIITVNEEITYTTTEGGTVKEWVNTGLAFVPADYEDRIVELESDTDKLKSDVTDLKTFCKTGEVVPENVITEASILVDKALSREDTRILRFLISSDAHHKNGHELITKGTKELAQAHGEILKMIGVDFVASLGDVTWGSSASDNATVLEEAKAFNKLMLPNIRGEKQIWTEGNHETDKLTESQIQSLIYSHNKALIQNTEQWIDGYGYMDFPNQKVRVICLNTDQATGNDSSGVSDIQLKWLAETALDMSDKTDWSVITMGHHPISFNNVTLMKNCAYVIEAFILGSNLSFTTNGGTEINIDYSDKSCQYVAHFHGHAHAYSVVKMQKRLDTGDYEEFNAWEICIPNACYTRNNQYKDNGTYTERYSTETTYNKEDVDGKRTSFNLITVCLDKKTIYADNYGVGVDREISY